MRGKKTLINTIMSLTSQIVTIICGFILPRLILERFGSQYNGLTSSITQFLGCAVLLRTGIGGATRAALYKPLANKNEKQINEIMTATNNFMKKIGIILAILIVAFAAVYPFFVNNEFSWLFTFSLFLIIGISTFVESFFGIAYLILLQADQKLWVSSLFSTISTMANLIIATILIKSNCTIHIVKLGSAIAFCIHPIALNIYVRKKYNINLNANPDKEAISQRWDVFWHQVATFVTNNTDVMVLTIFSNMLEVSVYSVYNMIVASLKNLVSSFSNGIEAAFGNMIANNENNALRENLSIMEFILYSIATVIYTCAILLIVQFVNVYTKGINDVDYHRTAFAYIILIANFFNCIRIPYLSVIYAAGKYKETKMGAIIEAIINVLISVILVIKFGLIGVAIGTLVAMGFRTIQLSFYMCNNIVKRNNFITIFKILLSFFEGIIIIAVVKLFNLQMPYDYLLWIKNAIIVFCVSSIIVILTNGIVYKKDTVSLIKKLKNII